MPLLGFAKMRIAAVSSPIFHEEKDESHDALNGFGIITEYGHEPHPVLYDSDV